MRKTYNSVLDLVGNTPIVELNNFKKKYNLKSNVFVKLESFNPAGSAKDRVAVNMILTAEKNNLIKKGDTIIEPTSGNTGIGLAMAGSLLGYKVVIVMPDSMSIERIKLIKAYGAKVVLTDGKLGMKGAIEKAETIKKEIKNSIIAGQFDNSANPQIHYETTGPEIYNDMQGNVDVFVAGIGTGGTISGVGKYLKGKNPNIEIIGVEPKSSPLINLGKSGAHIIQGIGANFIPKNLNEEVLNKVEMVSDEDALLFAREIAQVEGILVGISSGAALSVAINLAKKSEYDNKNIIVLLPDGGDKYLSTELFNI